MPDPLILRCSLLLLMIGALILLSVQELVIWRSQRGLAMHGWALAWSLNSLVFVVGRLVQHAGQTPMAGDIGTRIQFVASFATGVAAYGMLMALDPRISDRRPLWAITATGALLSLIVVTTDAFAINEGILRTEAMGNSYYVMSAGPWLALLAPYTLVTVGFAIVLGSRAEFGGEEEPRVLMFLALLIGCAWMNDIATLMGLYVGIELLDLAFFVVAAGVGFVVEREAEYRVLSIQEDLKDSRQEVEVSEARLRLLSGATEEGIAIYRDGLVVSCNQSLSAMTGQLTRGGWQLDDLWVPAHAIASATALSDPTSGPTEVDVRRVDGTTFPAEMVGRTASLHNREVGVLAIRDLTHRKQLESQLVTSDRIASLGRIAAGVGHEINNPLAYILGNVEFVRNELDKLYMDSSLRSELEDSLTDASVGCDRIAAISRDLTMLSRRTDDDVEATDVVECLESSVRVSGAEINQRAKVVKDYGPLVPARITASKLGQVFLNLLVNAAQAIEPGKPDENQITLKAGIEGQMIVVEIRDTGRGMPPEVAARIFEPFYTTKDVGEGTGIGLSICQNIVASAGGDIAVASELGVGTRFRVRIPIARDALAPPELDTTVGDTQESARVLIVDDDMLILRVVSRMLKEHAVTTTQSGAEAVELILRERPQLVLCDVMMPEVDGSQVYAQVLERDEDLAGRMVFMTGGVFEAEIQGFLDGIPNLVIDKPVRAKLVNALAREASAL